MLPENPTQVRPLTIAYIGNTRAPWCTEVHVGASLELLGHTVHRIQEDDQHNGRTWPHLADEVARLGADLLLWQRTWPYDHPDEQLGFLDRLRYYGIPSVAYHLDLYLGTVREHQITDEPWWQCDHVFTPDRRLDSDERTASRHHWLPPAVFGPECVRGTPQRQFAAAVSFVGSVQTYHPEWPHRRELVAWLQRSYGQRFKRWPRNRRPVRGADLNNLYASTQLAVGDSMGAGTIDGYWSDRIPETLGRGGVLVHPNVPGLAECFTPGEHLATWDVGNWGSLKATIDKLLAQPERIEAMRADGQAHVQAHHTYEVRMGQLLGYLADDHPELRADGSAPERPTPPRRVEPDTTRKIITTEARGSWQEVRLRGGTTDAEVFREVWDDRAYAAAEPYLSGGLVVDIGANVGAFSLWALAKGARLVHAWEPEPGNGAMLLENVTGRQVVIHPAAVGAKAGQLWLAPGPNGMHGGGTHAAVHTEPLDATDPQDRIPVECIAVNDALDSALADGDTIDVLKIDAEGAEYEIVKGLDVERLVRVRCLVMEFHGPGMPHLPHLRGARDFAPMVTKLAEYGHVQTMGRPSVGGTLTWRRY